MKHTMKILIIAPQPFYEKRGTPLAVALLARTLGEQGHFVDLLTYHVGESWTAASVRHFRSLNIPFIRSVGKGLSLVKLVLDVFVFAKAVSMLIAERYDSIHGVEEGAMMGVLLKGLFRVQLVYDMDSSIPEQLQDSRSIIWSRRPIIWLAEQLEQWTIRHSDLVLAVCSALQQRVVNLFPLSRVCLLEDIPVSEKSPDDLEESVKRIRKELAVGNAPAIVYTGTFEEYQGIGLLLDSIPEVLRHHPTAVFVLVGGHPDHVRSVSQIAVQRGFNHNIRVIGRRPLEEMPAFMALADLLVSPRTLGSNTPMKIYSYLQSGRPLVATRLPTHTQVLNDDVALMAEPTTTAFADAILRLLSDKAFSSSLGAAGAAYVAENYSIDTYREKLIHAYSLLRQ